MSSTLNARQRALAHNHTSPSSSMKQNSCYFVMAHSLQFVIHSPDSHALAGLDEVQPNCSFGLPNTRLVSDDVMIPGENHKQ